MVIGSHAFGHSAMYLQTGSCTPSLPRSCNNRIDAAVNCMVIEPRRNLVCGVFGISHSAFAIPKPLLKITLPSRAPGAEPVKSFLAAALRYSSSFDVIGAASCASAQAAKSDRAVNTIRRVARSLVLFIVPSSDWRLDGDRF